jgi:histone deacetylase 8
MVWPSESNLTSDCPKFLGLSDYCEWIAGASITAANLLLDGECDISICWDGGRHHAFSDKASGFCYINDIVLAIERLQTKFEKILYIDMDVHHGDGVESAFLYSRRVFTLSFHKAEPGFFPGSGKLDDYGKGKGVFHSVNVPLRDGMNGIRYSHIFEQITTHVVNAYRPDCIVLQCGADLIPKDPLGGLNVGIDQVGRCVELVRSFGLPTLCLGGGGYNPSKTACCWAYLTSVLVNVPIPIDIPEHNLWLEYAPSFELTDDVTYQEDKNTMEYVQLLVNTIKERLRNLKP